jgi:hypothetical protein
MLPGFRFLFAAIVLSVSILVFGLGAAALLRAAHDEFASNSSLRAAREAMLAQQSDATRPVLAMLRIEPLASEQTISDSAPAFAEPAKTETVAAATGAKPTAASKPEEALPSEAARSETPFPETPAQSEIASARTDIPAIADATKIAATGLTSPPAQTLSPANEAAPAASEPADASALREGDTAPTKIATLGGPAVTIETPEKADNTRPDRSMIEKRQHTRRAAHRRRMAARARQARLAQQQADPFAQPFAPPPAAARH